MIKRNNPQEYKSQNCLNYLMLHDYFPAFVSTARYFPENICLTLYTDWPSSWEYRKNRSWKHYRKTQWKENTQSTAVKKCGEQIGYLGRMLSVFKIFHTCPEETYSIKCTTSEDHKNASDVQVNYNDGTEKNITILCIKSEPENK